mgnify:CR=1 FL=1
MRQFFLVTIVCLQIASKNGFTQDITTVSGAGNSNGTKIEVKSGEVCEILNMYGLVVISPDPNFPGIYSSNAYGVLSPTGNLSKSVGQNFPIAGPIFIYVYDNAVVSYHTRSNISSSNSTPANAVVIPSDATGGVQIILESSTDLITWTQANPGTYGASTAKRFFRIRAVNQ